jgi:hypothetical protein
LKVHPDFGVSPAERHHLISALDQPTTDGASEIAARTRE